MVNQDQLTTTYGSGTVPHLQFTAQHQYTDGQFPVPQHNSARTRTGEPVVLINPEDLSVNIGLKTQAISVTTSAVALPSVPLEYRRALVIHNNGSSTLYLGGDATVTTSTGMPLVTNEKMAFDIAGNPNMTIYGISDGTANVRIMELA